MKTTKTESQKASLAFPLQFSKELQEFYKSHNVCPSDDSFSCYQPYRYVRLNPRYDGEQTLNMLQSELRDLKQDNAGQNSEENESNDVDSSPTPTAAMSVPWMESSWGFYALPENFPLSKSPCFRSGRIYGMDVSSGAGIAVLLTDYFDNAAACNPGYNRKKEDSPIQKRKDSSIDDNLGHTKELRILDLCCSPGLKLLQMADFFYRKNTIESSTHNNVARPVKVVGVDICEHRMRVCKSIVQKYFIDPETSGKEGASVESPGNVRIQLYLEDGTTFGVNRPKEALDSGSSSHCSSNNLIYDSRVALEEMVQRGGKRKRMNKSARAREKKKLRQIAAFESNFAMKKVGDSHKRLETSNDGKDEHICIELFDYVLVDAECSTDGSFKHIKERIKEYASDKMKKDDDHEEENTMLTDPKKLAELVDLQKKLLSSGFRLLKDGGTLVYSTCSLSEDQNEKVVKWLLESNPNALLIPIHFSSLKDTKCVIEGSLPGTIRFYPNLGQDRKPTTHLLGDGFYVAKITKRIRRT